jgi:hypothetical protein
MVIPVPQYLRGKVEKILVFKKSGPSSGCFFGKKELSVLSV